MNFTKSQLIKLNSLEADDVVFYSHYNPISKEHDDGSYPALLASDTFGYACADAESIYPTQVNIIFEIYELYGEDGLVAFISLLRKTDPLAELKTEGFLDAINYLNTYKEKENMFLSFEDIKEIVSSNIDRIIEQYKITSNTNILLIGVARGGLPILTITSHMLQKRLNVKYDIEVVDIDTRHNKDSIFKISSFNNNDYDLIVICEDIIDTGLTYNILNDNLKESNICYNVLASKINNIDIFSGITPEEYIDFDWEI